MSSRPPQPPEALLAHRQWVRALAQRLVADYATVDDLEQQTWLAALSSPPRHGGAPKAWLGTVLRSWLHKLRRGEQRRSRRERESARDERTPSTAEIVAGAEAHRRVVEAVFTLQEPLRTTVLLRFFEDLPIADVAARTGVPLETARSRVKRALELLRQTLDRDAGGRCAWLAALMPLVTTGSVLPVATLASGSVIQAFVMNTTQKLAIAGALLLLGGAAAYFVSTHDVPALTNAPDEDLEVAEVASAAAAEPDASAGRAATRAPAAPDDVLVSVLVRTWNDAPIEGAHVEACAAPPSGEDGAIDRPAPPVKARAISDATGTVRFADLAAGRWHFFAAKQGCCRAGAPDVVLEAGIQPAPIVIHLGAGYALEGRVLRGDGSAVAGAVVVAIPTSSALVRPRSLSDGQGRYRLEALRAGPVRIAAALPGGTVSTVETIQVPNVSQLDLVLHTGGILTGGVTNEVGEPIAGAIVRAQTSGAGYYKPCSAEAISDAQGRYRIDTLGEGLLYEIAAIKEGWVQVSERAGDSFDDSIAFRGGGTWTRDIVMGRGGQLVVTVRGPDGPVAGAEVAVQWALRSRDWPRATTDGQGVARFAAIATQRAVVGVRTEDLRQPGFPIDWWQVVSDRTAKNPYLVEARDGESATLEIALVKAAAIHGRVLGPDGQGFEGVQVDYANSSDRSRAAVTRDDGSFLLSGSRAGSVALSLTREGYVPAGPTVAEVPESGELKDLVLRMVVAHRVRGTVRAAGAPLGEAYVQVSMVPDREEAWQEEFRWLNAARRPLSADGGYEMPLPRADGRFAVRAVAVAHPSETSPPVSIVAGQSSYQLDLELEAGHTLAGRVVGPDAASVPGARLRAYWLPPGSDATRMIHGPDAEPALGVGDPSGRFTIDNLRSGRWQITAIAEGFLEESVEVRVPQDGELSIALPAELSLEGVVVDPDGRPVASAQLLPRPQSGNRNLITRIEHHTFSNPDGRFHIPRLEKGQYRIQVNPPRTGRANFRRMETGVVHAGDREVRIVVEPGAVITGRVIDEDGRALGGVSVGARGANDDDRAFVDTLRDGTFTLVGLQDGASYDLTVNADGGYDNEPYASLQQPYVAAGTTGLEFVLRLGLAIDGVVLDAAGIPVARIEIAAAPVGRPEQHAPMGYTDASGKFEIRGLEPGLYRLHIPQWIARGLLLNSGNDVAAGTSGLRLTAIEGAKLSGIVIDETGAPLASVELSAKATQAGIDISTWSRSRPDGSFDLSGLAPGAVYDLSARLRGRVPAVLHEVTAGSKDLRLQLERGLEVQGRLLTASGEPMADVNLRFVHADGLRVTARTENDGSFAVSGMRPGSYEVEALTGGVARLEVVPCGKVEAGQRGVELRLPR